MIEIIVRGVLVIDEWVLLCHSAGADNTFLPGGHIEFNESAPDALLREMKEETGLAIEADRLLGVVEHAFVQQGVQHCEVNLVFEMSADGLNPRVAPASRETKISFRWARTDALAEEQLEPKPLQRLLPLWIAGVEDGTTWASTYAADLPIEGRG